MKHRLETGHFAMEYTESKIENALLWESHCHPQFEMLAVLEGDISIMLEGCVYRLTANQAALIPPLAYHTVSANKGGLYCRVTALLDPSAIPEVLHPHFTSKDFSLALFYTHRAQDLKSVCQSADPHFYAPLAESLMTQIFYESLQSGATAAKLRIDPTLQKALTYIEKHLCDKITLDQLATHTARSKSSFCHLFQREMKISPKQYILQKRLALAAKMIRDGTPPTVAAVQVGYENYSNFYRIYQKNIGSVPSREKPTTHKA
ncbi:MAG: helix-turn-helix transcriptional regulator [Clostridia bacterium]|nr:helix-turn-helix transcriptional regulator [Clostridia bacterium]